MKGVRDQTLCLAQALDYTIQRFDFHSLLSVDYSLHLGQFNLTYPVAHDKVSKLSESSNTIIVISLVGMKLAQQAFDFDGGPVRSSFGRHGLTVLSPDLQKRDRISNMQLLFSSGNRGLTFAHFLRYTERYSTERAFQC
jgi:hypothetical protein